MSNEVDAFLEHHGVRGQKWGIRREHPSSGSSHASIPVDTKPWSSYTAADYTVEQWHAASLIHNHSGPPTSKSACKLPVKTPNGVVNAHGVFAAAAALAGARGGVQASAEQKAVATRALIKLYKQLGHKPPPSLLGHSNIDDFLDHHGVKGMKWGKTKLENLDRISRVAAGTEALKKRLKAKDALSTDKIKEPSHQDKLSSGREKVIALLEKMGIVRFNDLVPPEA